jgi:hypothetical protein
MYFEANGESRLHENGQRPDVVVVSVREHDGVYLVGVVGQPPSLGFLRLRDPAIDQDGRAAGAHGGHRPVTNQTAPRRSTAPSGVGWLGESAAMVRIGMAPHPSGTGACRRTGPFRLDDPESVCEPIADDGVPAEADRMSSAPHFCQIFDDGAAGPRWRPGFSMNPFLPVNLPSG